MRYRRPNPLMQAIFPLLALYLLVQLLLLSARAQH